MRQIITARNGSVDVLRIEESPTPIPKKNEVLIKVRAAGLNFADILSRQGLYPDAPRKPCVLGYEVSGVVEKTGDGVPNDLVSREVLALTQFGGQSEYVSVPADYVFMKPGSVSSEEAAAIPVNYITAYILLVAMGSLKRDETVLIHNAGGGVGLAALDLAKHIGARTLGTASESKHSFLQARGLDYPIDYGTSDWVDEVLKITNGKGVELAIDPIGPASWRKSYQVLGHTGRLGVFGFSNVSGNRMRGILLYLKSLVRAQSFRPLSLMSKDHGVFGFNWDT